MEARRKRLKIDVACGTCRAKKVKCDGIRPVCGYCGKRPSFRDSCRYSADTAVPREQGSRQNGSHFQPPPGVLVASQQGLRDQGHDSASAQSLPRVNCHDSPAPPRLVDQPSETTSNSNASPAGLPDQHHRPAPHSQIIGSSPQDPSPSVIDSMTTVVDEGTSTHEFFGNSSAGSFTAQIKRAIDTRLGYNSAANSKGTAAVAHVSSPFHGAAAVTDQVSYDLPPRRHADQLLELYWFYVDPLYPFLVKDLWERQYDALFTGAALDGDERLVVATLNIILALSTQLDESIATEQREESSNKYLRRAQELLPSSPWSTVGSIALVQCLLLTGQYLQSTNQPHQTWMVVGSAIRAAQGLGLHLPETTASCVDMGQRELCTRLWHGCVLMDRVVSLTHGRPAMISHSDAQRVAPPLCSSDRMSFFVFSVHLYEITHKVVSALYEAKASSSRSSAQLPIPGHYQSLEDDDTADVDAVVRLDVALKNWQACLPSHLIWEQLTECSDLVVQRQNLILRLRFLHARLILLRPILTKFCLSQPTRNDGDDSLHARVVEQCALLCVTTAQNIVTILHDHQRPEGSSLGLLPAWWYRVYYLYTAATILIATRLRPVAFPASMSRDVARSWSDALSLLRAHEKLGNSARRCVAALQILSSKISVSEGHERVDTGHTNSVNGADHSGNSPWDHGFLDDFAHTSMEMDRFNPADFDIDIGNPSWLNDLQAAWGVLTT